MSIADILIIYMAFGSPLMVHRFLTNTSRRTSRKILDSLFALAFWVPLVAEMGYRHLTNAYSKHAFVSKQDLDAVDQYIAEIRSILKTARGMSGPDFSRKDFLETLERYVALAAARRDDLPDRDKGADLFAIAGRDPDIGTACLERRNRRRIKNHHIRARRDLLEHLGLISTTRWGAATSVLTIRIARQLDDPEVEEALCGDEQGVDRSWITEQQSDSAKASTPLPPLAIAITPSSND